MPDRPTESAAYATATNYASGPHAPGPTKLALETVNVEQGNIAGIPPDARKFNWWQNVVYKWLNYFDNQVRRGIEVDPNGVHSAERGCLYTSQTDNSWWKNVDGDSVWERVYLVPDPSAQPDGKVLTVDTGAAVWADNAGVGGFPFRFPTTTFDEVDGGAAPPYDSGISATWDLPVLLPELPASCVVAFRVQWTARARTGEDAGNGALSIVLYGSARYEAGVLVAVYGANGGGTQQFHSAGNTLFDDLSASAEHYAEVLADTGLITSELLNVTDSLGTGAKATLIVEDYLERVTE